MVLSNAEFKAAADCEMRNKKKTKMTSLFYLRQSTNIFLIQCLADREIQKLIYTQEDASSKSAYRYNCAVVHSPHACAHLSAVNGHGWNNNQPSDPNLKLGLILARQHFHRRPNNVNNLAIGNHGQQQIDQFEETIRILQEENVKMKQNYLSRLTQLNDVVGQFNDNTVKADNQQVFQLQQKIQVLNSDLQSQAAVVRLLRDENANLQVTIKNLHAQSLSKNKVNVPDSRKINQLEHQLEAARLDLQHKNCLIDSLVEDNFGLQTAFREVQTQLLSNRLPSRSSRTNEANSQGCCTIM